MKRGVLVVGAGKRVRETALPAFRRCEDLFEVRHVLARSARTLEAAGRDWEVTPLADLPAIFRDLKALGLLLGIASSDSDRAVRRTASVLGIEDRTDFCAGWDSGHGPKPGPGMVLAFCAATGCEPASVVVVGDSRHDLEMGRAAGAGAVLGVLSGAGTRESLAPLADAVIDSVADLPACFAAPARR